MSLLSIIKANAKQMNKVNIQSAPERNSKSVKLQPEEIKALGKIVKAANSLVEAAEQIGIDRNVLDRVLFKGSGSPVTIQKIKAAIAA